MAEAIYDALGPVLTRWTMGAAAAPIAGIWGSEIGPEPGEAELRLLALSGQFLAVAVTAEPNGNLRTLPDVPALSLPTVPPALRPLTRRILQTMREGRQRSELLWFLAARGWTMHPGDWMPAAGDDDAPDVYAPWRDWAEAAGAEGAAGTASARRSGDALTTANWEDYWPAARKAALTELRARDPDGARALLEAKLPHESAEVRLRLLGLLGSGLSDADRTFLEAVAAADRAPKVKALAASLLARLGYGAAVGEDAAELAGFFEVRAKGLLRRSRAVTPVALKTPAQHNRRRMLFADADFAAFAGALALGADELAAIWTWGEDRQADVDFAAMAERSAPDTLIADLCERLGEARPSSFPVLLALLPRLDAAQRAGFARRMLRGGASYQTALEVAGGGCRIDGAIDMPAGAAILGALGKASDGPRPTDQAGELHALGLLASRPAAKQAMDRLVAAGLPGADPRLDMVRLNAALDDKGETG